MLRPSHDAKFSSSLNLCATLSSLISKWCSMQTSASGDNGPLHVYELRIALTTGGFNAAADALISMDKYQLEVRSWRFGALQKLADLERYFTVSILFGVVCFGVAIISTNLYQSGDQPTHRSVSPTIRISHQNGISNHRIDRINRFVLQEPISNFIGRKSQLVELQELFEARNKERFIVHVTGPDGIGKKELCRKFAQKIDPLIPVSWLNAESSILLVNSLTNLALNRLNKDSILDIKVIIDQIAVKMKATSTSAWIVILSDVINYDDAEFQAILLTLFRAGAFIIITGRSQVNYNPEKNLPIKEIQLDGLLLDEMVQLFQSELKPLDYNFGIENVVKVCHMVQFNPLAIRLAASYLGRNVGNVNYFLQKLETSKNMDDIFLKMVELAKESLKNPNCDSILEVMSFSSGNEMDFKFLRKLSTKFETTLPLCITELSSYSILNIKRWEQNDLIFIEYPLPLRRVHFNSHSIQKLDSILSSISDTLPSFKTPQEIVALTNTYISVVTSGSTRSDLFAKYSPLLNEFLNTLSNTPNMLPVLTQLSLFGYHQLTQYSRKPGILHDKNFITMETNIAQGLMKSHKYYEGLSIAHKLREKSLQLHGENHADTVKLTKLIKSGEAAWLHGKDPYQLAQELGSNPDIAKKSIHEKITLFENIANNFFDNGFFQDAIHYYKIVKGWKIYKYGAKSRHTLDTILQLGICFSNINKFKDAITQFETVFDNSLVLFGEEDDLSIGAMEWLGLTLYSYHESAAAPAEGDSNDLGRDFKIMEKVVTILERIKGKENEETVLYRDMMEKMKVKYVASNSAITNLKKYTL
ncbi:hypothetical protein Fcan01_00508 [Folsomia candida]|uniref:Uncharacterized protein n=2 Tax=Folsomia candida TaxID=158441 RepID=A0A226F3E8_FOLCA|nr:hypothetical protein Fcan01_00508 [Folsomia candida]